MERASAGTRHSSFASLAVALAAVAFVMWMASFVAWPERIDSPSAHEPTVAAGALHRALPSA